MNLTEAFQKMDLLESEEFDISSSMDSADLRNFIDEDELDDSIDVVDLQAEEEDDIEDSYIGKVIIECNVCHSKFYKDPSEVEIDDETGSCNMDEECPICFSQDGYKVIGKVAPYTEVPEMEDEFEVEVDGEPVEVDYVDEDEDDDDLEEAYDRDYYGDEELDETIKGAVGGAILGGIHGARTGKGILKGAIRGAALGDGLTNEMSGKGHHATNYAKMGYGATGKLGKAALAGAAGFAAGDKVKQVFGKLPDILKSNGVSDGKIKTILNSMMSESLKEEFTSAAVETDDSVLSMDSDEYGKVTITSEPKQPVETGDEMLAPLDFEDEREVTGDDVDDGLDFDSDEEEPMDDEEMGEEEFGEEEEGEEAPEEEDSVDISDFDEESFDELGESYLRKVYNNVNSFNTSSISKRGNKLVVEGVINFNSGKTKKTHFIFEALGRTKKGKVKFIGENAQIAKGKKAFTVTGKLRNRKYIPESLNYNYRQKDAKGKSVRLYGTIKR